MPSGHVHRKLTVPVSVAAGAFSCVFVDVRFGLLVTAGGLITLAIHPDLDIVDASWKRRLAQRKLSIVWWALWMPYAKSIRHRSPMSHWPLMGTMFRLLYLLFPLLIGAIVAVFYFSPPPSVFSPFGEAVNWLVPFVVGMIVSDTMHWVMDKVL